MLVADRTLAGHWPQSSLVCLRPYAAADRPAVLDLLRELPLLYPGGDAWLRRRLADAVAGRATVTLAAAGAAGDILVGITIETPKGAGRIKLSTIMVAPVARSLGVGGRLMDAAAERWDAQGAVRVHVTADVRRADDVERLVGRYGFRRIAVEPDRYGPGRSEAVFVRER